jgi:hypothetical protein
MVIKILKRLLGKKAENQVCVPIPRPVITLDTLPRIIHQQSTQLWTRFQTEFCLSNAQLCSKAVFYRHIDEFIYSWGPFAVVLFLLFGFYATCVVFNRQRFPGSPLIAFVMAELSAVLCTILPLLLPFKALRFVFGLVSFIMFMGLHSRLIENQAKDHFGGQLLSTFFGNIRSKLKIKLPPTLPALSSVVRWITILFLLDGSMYLTREWIPLHISTPTGQYYCSGLITGLWVLFAMEFNYQLSAMALEILGYPLPLDIRHKNPLMSISLSEFWGLRWNPVVCKLLQSAFYKPLRRLGVTQILCVVACFAGE